MALAALVSADVGITAAAGRGLVVCRVTFLIRKFGSSDSVLVTKLNMSLSEPHKLKWGLTSNISCVDFSKKASTILLNFLNCP